MPTGCEMYKKEDEKRERKKDVLKETQGEDESMSVVEKKEEWKGRDEDVDVDEVAKRAPGGKVGNADPRREGVQFARFNNTGAKKRRFKMRCTWTFGDNRMLSTVSTSTYTFSCKAIKTSVYFEFRLRMAKPFVFEIPKRIRI
jgi:hypothetical protein